LFGRLATAGAGGLSHWLARLLPWAAVALALTAFAGALSYPFVDDDRLMIVNNPVVRSWSSVPRYFVEDAWGHSGQEVLSNYYRPAQLLWLRLNYAVFALEPGGYHAACLALHGLATGLLFLLARHTLKDRLAAGFAALIFAVHPIHVEPAVWISGATETQLAVSFLAAVLGYLVWRERRDYDAKSARRWLAFSLAAYALALLTKESAVLLGGIFLIYEWKWRPATSNQQPASSFKQQAPGNKLWATGSSQKLAACGLLLAIFAAYLAARSYALRAAPRAGSGAPLASILLTLPQIFAFDLRKLVWPLPLSLFYPLQLVTRPGLANFVLPLAVSLAALAGLWIWSRRSEDARWASVWLLVPLATPLFGITRFLSYDLFHDRFLYLSSAGLAMLAAVALRRLKGGREVGGVPLAQLAAVLVLTLTLGTLTVTHTRQWSGEVALYRQAARVAPHSPLALNQLAMAELRDEHDLPAALNTQERAFAVAPDDFTTLLHTGIMRRNAHDYDGALPLFLRARKLDPERRDPHFYLGLIYVDRAQYAEAETELRQAIRLAPQRPEQHALLGFALQNQGRIEEARSEYQAELQINPNSAKARQALAALPK
jgi:tetratricopeptide (TPR) repeat protein